MFTKISPLKNIVRFYYSLKILARYSLLWEVTFKKIILLMV